MAIKVTELDFFQIKENLKAHMKSLQGQGKFTDYDFDGSGMNMLLDLLAYNTHYNAMNANMSLNEVFLDSADRRNNIVSHAKMLGYVPRSRAAATAIVDIAVTNPIDSLNPSVAPTSITLNRGAQFSTIINDKQFFFTNLETINTVPVAGVYKFTNVALKQGTLKNISYIVDSFDSTQYFEIPDTNIDRETLVVKVKENMSETAYDVYTLTKNFTSSNYKSKAYYIQEGLDGKFEIYFGDGITSKKLTAGNVVIFEWLSTDGPDANGASLFTSNGDIAGSDELDIATIAKGAGGAEKESNQSIKFNAPLTYVAQNRVVTPDDYKAAILENYSNVESIAVWGGEQNDPPQYGKAYISVKPKTGDFLSPAEKQLIKDQILKPRNIVSITPEIIDPEYTYLRLEVFFKYNPALTSRTSGELQKLVSDVISAYNDSDLKQFDGVFRHSKLSRLIDTCDPSILNSSIRVYMEKYIYPTVGTPLRYQITFSSPLYTSRSNESVIKTSAFYINGVETFIQDKPQELGVSEEHSDEGGTHTLQMYKVLNNTKIVTKSDTGYIIATDGTVIVNAFNPTALPTGIDYVRFTALPNSLDIAPKRNQLLRIDMSQVTVNGQVDTIATGGAPAGVGYTTISRHSEEE